MSRISSGVTILELVLATMISTFLIGAVISAYIVSMRLFSQQTGETDIFWNGQRSADVMVGEIRESLSVVTPNPNSLSFWWKDLNGNSSREANETVTYSLSGHDLMRSLGASVHTLASNVDSINFSYDATPNPRLVTITLVLSSAGETASVESKVKIRNAN